MKYTAILIIALFFAMQNNCNAQNKPVKKEVDKTKNTEVKKDKKVNKETNLKVLASGSYSGVEEPFIFVARDKESFEKLSNFPLNKIEFKENVDFEKNIVVAAFAGEFRTGGYSVEINQTDGKVFVNLKSPPKDGMVTQALTQPFSVVLVPIKEGESLNLEVSDYWKNKSQNYSVKSGSVEYSGGIAGINKQFETDGNIQIYKLGNFVTLVLDLKGKDKDSNRKLSTIITGELKDNSLVVENINGGNLIEIPHPPMKFEAKFSDDKISINLIAEDENSPVRDGFSGRGTFEAAKVN